MKKLYHAEVSGEFVFVVDTDKVKNGRELDEAYANITSEKISLDVNSIHEVEDGDEIPPEWIYLKPFGADGKDDDNCKSYFEGIDAANRVTAGLVELGYELEDTFAEDIRNLLKREI